jgi:hypothetical protein
MKKINAATTAPVEGTRNALDAAEIARRDIDRAIDAAVLADAGGGAGWVCLSKCRGCSGTRKPDGGCRPS